MPSWVHRPEVPPAAHETGPDRAIRLWPVFALLPVVLVGTVKATGWTTIGGVDTTVLSVIVLLGASGAAFLQNSQYPVREMLPIFAFALVVLLGVARSDPGEYQQQKAQIFFLLTGVIVCCLPVILRDVLDLRGLLAVWFVSGTLTAVLVFFVGGSENLYGGRAGIEDATLTPAYLCAAALVVAGAGLGERLLPLSVALPSITVTGIALVTIGSRGPMAGAVFGLAVWALMRGLFRLRTVLITLLFVTVALVGGRLASEWALTRLTLFENPARRDLRAIALGAFQESPGIGIGWGNYPPVGELRYPHNLFLETGAELGLLGLLALLIFLAAGYVRLAKCRSMAEARCLGAVAAVMVAGQFFSYDLTNRVFWVALVPLLLLPRTTAVLATGRRRERVVAGPFKREADHWQRPNPAWR